MLATCFFLKTIKTPKIGQGSLNYPCGGGIKQCQVYGMFEGFPIKHSAFFGLVI